MKKKFLIISAFCAMVAFAACNGDHSTKGGADSVKDRYSAPSDKDTSKITTTTGDASNVENSGSGGTKIAKDTSKLKSKDTTKK